MKAINVFHKGINTTLDYSKRSNDVWDLPTLNARLINKDGKGLIVTSVNGNQFDPDNGIGFELPAGFIPIGAKDHNGIAYILSFNPSTGEGEIGTFPSPKAIESYTYGDSAFIRSSNTGFERKYKPLINYEEVEDSRIRKPFRTEKFEFDIEKMAEIVIAPIYDGSVNLYICDGKNYNRIINSGFDQEGNISYTINAISTSSRTISIGAKYFYIQKGLDINIGDKLYIWNDEDNYMIGSVVNYDALNGYLDVTIDSVVGAGTYAEWNITVEKATAFLYSENSFPYAISQVPLVNKIPKRKSLTISSGGQWKSGNTFLFIRLVTENFNRTKFLTDIGPIQICEGEINSVADWDSVCGISGLAGENGYGDISDKRIVFTLENLDTQYKFIEVAYIRYFGDVSRVPIQEVKLINTLYDIKGDETQIILTGTESTTIFTEGELISEGIKELTCESHAIVNNIYFGANWTKEESYHVFLQKYAEFIKPKYDDTTTINKQIGYKDYQNTIDKVGYFRGEIYPFGMVYVFKGGLESEAFPTKAYDDIDDLYVEVDNAKSLYRFPSINNSNLNDGDNLKIMGIILDNVDAEAYRLSDSKIETWFNENIIGYYFVRSDRWKNLKYQGMLMYGARAYVANPTSTLAVSKAIVEQYNERQTIFNIVGTQFAGAINDSVPHGCSTIDYNVTTTVYSNYTGSGSDDAIGAFKNGTLWASWLGQCHKKQTENQASSECWGANRGPNENIKGGGKKDLGPGHEGNECNYNDAPDKWNDDGGICMPIYKGFIPNTNVIFKSDDERVMIKNYCGPAFYIDNHYGFFAPDYIVDFIYKVNTSDVIKVYGTYKYFDNKDGSNKSQISITSQKLAVDTYPWWWHASLGSNSITYNAVKTISGAKFSNIEKYVRVNDAKDGFASEYTDPGLIEGGFTQKGTCMWYWEKDGARYQGGGNRSMSTCKYIGVKLDDYVPDLNFSLVNIYDVDPNTIAYDDIKNYIDYENARFSKISELITLGDSTSSLINFKGDCFLQQTFIKQMAWRGSTFTSTNVISGAEKDKRENNDVIFTTPDEQPLVNFGHGLVMEFVTENENNIELRYESGGRSFYPKVKDLKAFAVYNPDTTDKTESLLLNVGYNQILSPKRYFYYAKNLIFEKTKFETRVRYTDRMIEGSYVDAYRNFKELNYKDYDTNNGPIVRLQNFLDNLFSIQHKSINQHYIGAKEIKIDSSAGAVNLGTGQILEQQVKGLAPNGSQHKWGVYTTNNGMYVVDFNKRIINCIKLSTTGLSTAIAAEDISFSKNYSDRVINIFEEFEKLTDITKPLKDTPLNGEGLYIGYDNKYRDVIFSLISQNKNITFVFNEELQSFTTDLSFVSPFYLSLNNDFYSANSANLSQAWLHDRPNRLSFYGQDYEGKISVIVNGLAEEQNTVNFSKRYDSLEIEASETGIKEIQYSTLKQIGLHDNFDTDPNKFWLAPDYAEGSWKLPIQSQTTPGTSFFSTDEFMGDSDMRGKWMKIEVTFDGEEDFFLKSVISNYEISNV